MDMETIEALLRTQEEKLNAVVVSVDKMRKYFMWTFIITIVALLLPLLGILALVPWLLRVMGSAYSV